MGVVIIKHKGNLKKTETFLQRMSKKLYLQHLDKLARKGVDALSSATPVDTGLTAASWSYEIHSSGDRYQIDWINSNVNKGVPIALILQYGHGTGTGGYVQGRDYINPAIQPIFDEIAESAWAEVTKE